MAATDSSAKSRNQAETKSPGKETDCCPAAALA